MKKTSKKSVPENNSTQPAVLRLVNPITTEETPLKNLPVRPRDGRLSAVGAVITKKYHGQNLEVKVLENGFEYQGKIYKSISRVAMEIVKRPISGYVFFGLSK